MLVVNRGPSLASASSAIVVALLADSKARQERLEAHRQWSEEAFRAVVRRPDRVALQTLPTLYQQTVKGSAGDATGWDDLSARV
jgi:hypothetical protein